MASYRQTAHAVGYVCYAVLTLLILFSGIDEAQATCTPNGTLTTNLNLCQPASGETGWAAAINGNATILDALYSNANTAKLAGIVDVNGNVWLVQSASPTAVNGFLFTNASTGIAPILSPGGSGSDTNVDLSLQGKGAGVLRFPTVTFSTLPASPVNGQVVLCSDCTSANPCNSGGTGALAKRISSAWVCN